MQALIERSEEFAKALRDNAAGALDALYEQTPRYELAAGAVLISIEHAYALRLAMAYGAPSSAIGLLRLQFEAGVRGAWLLYAASDANVGALSADLDEVAERAAKDLPMASVMLQALRPAAPVALVDPLVQFRDGSWPALNSFVHTGLHALRRNKEGLPMELAMQVVRNSNGLLDIGHRLLVSLTGDQVRMTRMSRVHVGFKDCLPR